MFTLQIVSNMFMNVHRLNFRVANKSRFTIYVIVFSSSLYCCSNFVSRSARTWSKENIGFTGQLDQELKKLTAKQVIDLIWSKPEILPPDWAQDLVRKPKPESPTDCVFTTTESITTVEPESIPTIEFILQPTPSTVDDVIITITIPCPILRATNAIPNSTSSVPSYPTTKSVFTNGDPTVNTNERTSITKQ
ncbi:MAG: hypothetical protein EZS28_047239 [Streblomastix strix]|uniref:Uncharacterized protein n=1 Tax=Streblomastix strix TaxID=222440 RepID=A0A5J4THF1_9EUKA|nr:MAG: hypothetical protein EZS28_047239 [Streblomastix strix]